MTVDDLVVASERWMSFRPWWDREPAARVQSFDGGGGGGAPDGHLVPVCREVDLERAALSLEPALRAVAFYWRETQLYRDYDEEFDQLENRRRRAAFARALAQYGAAADPVAWPTLEEVVELQAPRDDGGRFAGKIRDDDWWDFAKRLRRRAARAMAAIIGTDW